LKFSDFKNNIDKLKQISLGGLESQFKLIPAVRPKFDLDKIVENNPKLSAVLCLFYPNNQDETCFILTKRAQYKGVHSSQISFPGGKQETFDTDLRETALRETYEEIGINNIKIFRNLTKTYIPPSNFYVSPFMGYVDKINTFKTNEEVVEILEIKLADLLDDCNLSVKQMTTSYMQNVEVPYFKLQNEIVWGATAMILSEIKDLFKALLL